MDELGDLENGNLNDIIRNALSMALDQSNAQDDYQGDQVEDIDMSHTEDLRIQPENQDEGDDEANMRLMEQLQAVISSAEHDNRADTRSVLHEKEQQQNPTTESEKPIRELSIAETLALSRNKMKLRPANNDDVIDPMVTRYGLRRQTTETGGTVMTKSATSRKGAANVVAAATHSQLALSRKEEEASDTQRDAEMENENNGEDTLDPDALDAVQVVLQALGRSSSQEDASAPQTELNASDIDPAGASREKRRRRYRTNQELTPEEKERIRIENRLRKKKWRGINSDRNKDNDLRARLHRRAIQKFGAQNSPQKTKWIEEEFGKRREKRLQRDKNISGKVPTFEEREINASASEDSDLGTALETLAQSDQLDIKDAVNSLVKDPSVLKSMIDFLNDGTEESGDAIEPIPVDEELMRLESTKSTERLSTSRTGNARNSGQQQRNVPIPKPPPYMTDDDKPIAALISPPEREIMPEGEDEDLGARSLGFPPPLDLRRSSHGRA